MNDNVKVSLLQQNTVNAYRALIERRDASLEAGATQWAEAYNDAATVLEIALNQSGIEVREPVVVEPQISLAELFETSVNETAGERV